jgi:phosphoheptose isomerase
MMQDDVRARAASDLHSSAETMGRVAVECLADVEAAAAVMTGALVGGGKLLICGNGGSAADAQHLATEFVSTLTTDNLRPSISAIALTTDTSVLTAIANDFGLDGIFSRQVESIGRTGDVLIAISTSGDSTNVVRAAEQAGRQGIGVVALTGASGGEVARHAQVTIKVPSSVTAHIQECHLAVEHLLASLVEDALHPRHLA